MVSCNRPKGILAIRKDRSGSRGKVKEAREAHAQCVDLSEVVGTPSQGGPKVEHVPGVGVDAGSSPTGAWVGRCRTIREGNCAIRGKSVDHRTVGEEGSGKGGLRARVSFGGEEVELMEPYRQSCPGAI